VAPDNTFNAHTKLLRTLVPSFAARMKANRTKKWETLTSRDPKANPPLCGPQFDALLRCHGSVLLDELPELHAVVLHMRKWDWDDPSTTYKDWWDAFVAEVSDQTSQLSENTRH
jgi:hypothetical protein